MIDLLITSVLLSWAGAILYVCWVRQYGSLWQRKGFIYLVIVSSLLAPVLSGPPPVAPAPSPAATPFGLFKPVDEHALQHYCRCEQPNYTHRITYRANGWYNALLDQKPLLKGLLLLAMALVVGRFLVQYLFLWRLVRRGRHESLTLGDTTYTLLHFPEAANVGAFQLDKPYIIWQKEMEQLSPEQQQAIWEHELSHIRQMNTLEKICLSMLQVFWLLNPAFYLFRKELDLLSELVADQHAASIMGSKKAYANLLLQFKSHQLYPGVSHLKGSSLSRRIHHLIKGTSKPRKRAWGPFLVLVVLQFQATGWLQGQVQLQLEELETYEVIYQEHPQEHELMYCPDCHSACYPEE
ncbi:MAG: M56 family metallopeptidase [Bacteroidota bacterium]